MTLTLYIDQGQKFWCRTLHLKVIYLSSQYEVFRSKGIQVTAWTKFGWRRRIIRRRIRKSTKTICLPFGRGDIITTSINIIYNMTNLWARQNKTVNKHCNIKPSTKRKPSRFFCTKMHQNLNYCQFIFNILYFYIFYKEQNKFSWIGTISLLFGYFTLLKTCYNRFCTQNLDV